jgi:hypothetical protein
MAVPDKLSGRASTLGTVNVLQPNSHLEEKKIRHEPHLSLISPPHPYLPRSHSSPSQCISPATPPHAGTPSSESCRVPMWPLPRSEGSKTCRMCRHFPQLEDRLVELRTPRGQVHAMDGAGSSALGH